MSLRRGDILRAEETGVDLSEGKQLTASGVTQAIEGDPRDLQIPTELPEPRQEFGDLLGEDWSTSNVD